LTDRVPAAAEQLQDSRQQQPPQGGHDPAGTHSLAITYNTAFVARPVLDGLGRYLFRDAPCPRHIDGDVRSIFITLLGENLIESACQGSSAQRWDKRGQGKPGEVNCGQEERHWAPRRGTTPWHAAGDARA